MKERSPASSVAGGMSRMPAPGDVVAEKYRIDAVLGRGGMSVVYRATHLSLDRPVAIKVLSADALLLPEYIVRLKREARAVSRIRSEHVVRVYDVDDLSNAGVPYLVMECLSGLDLAAVLARRGPLPVDLAVECVLQTCEALAEAHALGIVHRDLKPANLFLTEAVDATPCVKVLDFGISRMSRQHGLSALTDPGTVLGTPSYMAPEQMEAARTIDARTDIWALGTILYELVVGRPPYTGDSLPRIFLTIMRSPRPKPSSLRSGLPSRFDAIVARCLEVDPTRRYPTVADLGWALSRLGTPRGRDSAARIERVFDRWSVEATPSETLRSSLPRPAVNAARRSGRASGRRRGSRRLPAAVASVVLVGVASAFGVLTVRGAGREGAVRPADQARIAPLAAPSPAEDAALGIAPATRPLDDLAPASSATAPLGIERAR